MNAFMTKKQNHVLSQNWVFEVDQIYVGAAKVVADSLANQTLISYEVVSYVDKKKKKNKN